MAAPSPAPRAGDVTVRVDGDCMWPCILDLTRRGRPVAAGSCAEESCAGEGCAGGGCAWLGGRASG